MTPIVEINYDDITIADEYLNGQTHDRCKNALWNIYNLLIEMMDTPAFDGRQTAAYKSIWNMLYLLSKNAIFRDGHMDTLMWLGEFAPGEWVSAEKYQYLAEDFGFVFGDFIYKEGVKPKKKIDMRKLSQLSLSYAKNDYEDVIFGLKLFADICAKHSWPFFMYLDIRVAFKNAVELGLPLGRKWDAKVPPREMFDYFLLSDQLKSGANSLLELAAKFKLRHHEKSHRSYTFTYKGKNVMNLCAPEVFDRFEVMLNIGRGDEAINFLDNTPDNLRAEYLDNLYKLHQKAHGEVSCTGCESAAFYEGAGDNCWIATCGFGYKRVNPSASEFALIAEIISRRVQDIP